MDRATSLREPGHEDLDGKTLSCTVALGRLTAAAARGPSSAPAPRGLCGVRGTFCRLGENGLVPLICPTCQNFSPDRSSIQRPPATLHGVVFDIFSSERRGPASLRNGF